MDQQSKQNRITYASMHFPILRFDHTHQQQRDKLIEEYNELKKEIFKPGPPDRLIHEAQDIIQALLTLIYIDTRTTALDDQEAEERVKNWAEDQNQQHRKKIEKYRAERGWQ